MLKGLPIRTKTNKFPERMLYFPITAIYTTPEASLPEFSKKINSEHTSLEKRIEL